jgi:hypothetical protein
LLKEKIGMSKAILYCLNTIAGAIAAASLLIGLQSCCLKQLELKPQYNVATSTGSADIVFSFKECCPSPQQKKDALALGEKVSKAWDDRRAGRISDEEYNQLENDAVKAINQVILVCESVNGQSTETPTLQRRLARDRQRKFGRRPTWIAPGKGFTIL